ARAGRRSSRPLGPGRAMALIGSVELTVDGVPGAWVVLSLRGRERIHAPFSFELTCQNADELHVGDLLTKPARVVITGAGGRERTIQGVVDSINAVAEAYEIRLVPAVALLEDAIDHQVFLDEDAVAIAKAVLGEHGLSVDSRVSRKAR